MALTPASQYEVDRVRRKVEELERRVARLEHEERLRSYDLPPWFWVMIATSILMSAVTIAAGGR